MDLQILTAAHLSGRRPAAPLDARAEDRYYRDHDRPVRPTLMLLGQVAATAGFVLMIIGIAQA